MSDRVFPLRIQDSLGRIREYVAEGRDAFFQDRKTQDAVLRNLKVIGDATKRISTETRQMWTQLPWKKMVGMRDLLIHHCFGIKLETVWEAIEQELPSLRAATNLILQDKTIP